MSSSTAAGPMLAIDGEWYDLEKWATHHPGGRFLRAAPCHPPRTRPGGSALLRVGKQRAMCPPPPLQDISSVSGGLLFRGLLFRGRSGLAPEAPRWMPLPHRAQGARFLSGRLAARAEPPARVIVSELIAVTSR